PRTAARHPRRLRRCDLRHPARERARAQPEPRHRGRRRALRGSAAAGQGLVSGRRIAPLALAVLVACSAVPLPRPSPYHVSDADLTVTRITHASVIVDLHGTRLLVDPWFHSGLVARQTESLGLTPDALPAVAGVLLTHRHDGYFDEAALRALAPAGTVVVARPELHAQLAALGFEHIVDLGWWDHTEVQGVTVTAVPARHAVPENGYVVEGGGVRVYVAGDTRWFPELVD